MADSIRPKAEIEAEIEAARDRLAHGLASLINEVHPRAIAHRTVVEARTATWDRLRAVRSQFVASDGSLNLVRTGLVAAAATGAVVFVAVVRSIVRR